MKKFDYLVVGSGLYGAIFAHEAKAHGKSVLVVDKRPNIAGNIYTENVEGINVHADELDEEIRALTKQASEKTYIGGLTKECVDAFVSMVYLYDDQSMKIEFNCEDVIRRALEKYGA